MKNHLAVFLVVALAALAELPGVRASSVDILSHCVACPDEFKGKLVCAFINGCYLEIEYCSMVVFNCGRQQHHKHLFLVVNEGKCTPVRGFKCETMDF
ncbi:uncharacterized protein LOC6733334 [Drosophila simulans]|uniref:GD10272 n=1 Tax=Drosophila simulans TaxID=7240 RepID=B4QDW4_DROSI|nr:uncharacterized protein LOC6733334 [Drosophila simulans]EDX05976.1 GD10272 [Drosophila simulans]KMY91923.1 uncharacterized protein Dsimw501_GD10272 [Drosophila simulans]